MNTAKLTGMPQNQTDKKIPLRRLFYLYLLIGLTGFGPTLAAETKKRLIHQEGWLKEEDFINGLALAQMLPGATFVNLAVYAGYKLRGIAGALSSFAAILLMPFTLMVILSHIYFTYHSVEFVSGLFRGTAVVIVGVIANAVIELGRSTIRDKLAVIIAVVAAGLLFYSRNPFIVLLVAAIAGIAVYYHSFQQGQVLPGAPAAETQQGGCWGRCALYLGAFGILTAVALYWVPIPPVLTKLWWVFFRMGSILFGGGLAMIPVIQQEIVDYYGWLTLDEFAVGIALSQVTPGPVLIIATFIGYKVAAIAGAAAATLGVFLPSLFLVMSTAEFHQRIRNNSGVRAGLRGLAASFTGMMVVMVVNLGKYALVDIPAVLVTILVFVMLRFGRMSVIAAIIAGMIVYSISALIGII